MGKGWKAWRDELAGEVGGVPGFSHQNIVWRRAVVPNRPATGQAWPVFKQSLSESLLQSDLSQDANWDPPNKYTLLPAVVFGKWNEG